MKNLFLTLTVLTLIFSACAPATNEPDANDSPVSQPGDGESPASPSADYLPRPEDSDFVRGPAYIDSTDLLTLESFPLQFTLNVKGTLPTPCSALRVAVSEPDAENKVAVEIYSVAAADAICAAVLEPFEVNISLGSFPEGNYTLWVNGEMIAEFTA